MSVIKQAQRSMYAAVGAGARALDALDADTREKWARQARETYDELADRGQAVLDRAEHETRQQAREAERAARRVPGIAPVEGEVSGFVADEGDLPISDYDNRTVDEITEQLPRLSQRELHRVEGYETRHRGRSTVLHRVDELRGDEPWPGYDEMTVDEILPQLRALPTDQQSELAAYERRHKQRRTVLDAAASHGSTG